MIFSCILIAHWVGDYLLQTSNMALGKSKSLKWLFVHTLTYSAVILVVSLLLFSSTNAIKFALINGILHGIIDFFTSKIAAKYSNQPRIFFPILGFDQLLHIITLHLTLLHLNSIF